MHKMRLAFDVDGVLANTHALVADHVKQVYECNIDEVIQDISMNTKYIFFK